MWRNGKRTVLRRLWGKPLGGSSPLIRTSLYGVGIIVKICVYRLLYKRYMQTYKAYTDEDFIKAVANNQSVAGVLRELNLRQAGGNYHTVQKHIQRLKVDTSHWTGQAWLKNEQLKDWQSYAALQSVKRQLIKLRGHKCEECDRKKWRGQQIAIELHHIDGNRTNNTLENLQLLCPNCHSLTPNYKTGNNNRTKKPANKCKDCMTEIKRSSIRCVKCARRHRA